MIENFKKTLEETVTKIRELDQELNLKKEEYFKLTGAVQALELAAQSDGTEGGTITDTTPPTPPADGMVPPTTPVPSTGVIQ